VSHPELPIRIRVGISAGRPVDTGSGLFGLAVVAAARICALAGADQVYVSDAVRAAAAGVWSFRPVGDVELKGLPGPQPVFEALPVAAH
jgi:class 3 adenylate cyclase